jgi:hypothetical protein
MTSNDEQHVPWNEREAVEIDISSRLRINGEVWAVRGFTKQVHVSEWDTCEVELGKDDEAEWSVEPIPEDEDVDTTVVKTETTDYKDGQRVRTINSTMTIETGRPFRAGVNRYDRAQS